MHVFTLANISSSDFGRAQLSYIPLSNPLIAFSSHCFLPQNNTV